MYHYCMFDICCAAEEYYRNVNAVQTWYWEVKAYLYYTVLERY